MGTQEPLRFNQYPPYLLAQYQQQLPSHLLVQYGQALGQQALGQWLAQCSEQEFVEWRDAIMPRLRSAGLLSARRMRIQEHRWYPNDGEVFHSSGYPGYEYPEDKRALNLLRRHLTDEQWWSLGRLGHFEVVGRMRRYGRMRSHRFQIQSCYGVYELEKSGRRHHCIVALEPGLPAWDWMLCVKLLIESDLKKFYATAKSRRWQPVSCNQLG